MAKLLDILKKIGYKEKFEKIPLNPFPEEIEKIIYGKVKFTMEDIIEKKIGINEVILKKGFYYFLGSFENGYYSRYMITTEMFVEVRDNDEQYAIFAPNRHPIFTDQEEINKKMDKYLQYTSLYYYEECNDIIGVYTRVKNFLLGEMFQYVIKEIKILDYDDI